MDGVASYNVIRRPGGLECYTEEKVSRDSCGPQRNFSLERNGLVNSLGNEIGLEVMIWTFSGYK